MNMPGSVLCLLLTCILLAGQTCIAATISLPAGWTLSGNSTHAQLAVETLFGSKAQPVAGVSGKILSVWAWDIQANQWSFHSPQLTSQELAAYTEQMQYKPLTTIRPGEGYWVNAAEPVTIVMPDSTSRGLGACSLASGWNLVSSGENLSPQTFNATVSSDGSGSILSLWAWDNERGRWYFWSPALAGMGGSALSDYAASMGYLDFGMAGRTLAPQTGFWVNAPFDSPSGWTAPAMIGVNGNGHGSYFFTPTPIAVTRTGCLFTAVPWLENGNSMVAAMRRQRSGWNAAEMISPLVGYLSETNRGYFQASIDADDAGAAIAAWIYRNVDNPSAIQNTSQAYVSHFKAATGWGSPILLQNDPQSYATNIMVKSRPTGEAWAVWNERIYTDGMTPNDRYAVFVAAYTPESGWGTPVNISGDFQGQLYPRIALNENGAVIILFTTWSGNQIYAVTRNGSAPWSAPALVVDAGDNGGFSAEADFSMDGQGNAFVAWRQYDGTRYVVRARRHTVLAGWEQMVELSLPGIDNANSPNVAMDSQGNAVISWHELDGLAYGIWAAFFDVVHGWNSINLLSAPAAGFGDDATNPQLAFDSSGNAIAVWTKYALQNNRTVLKARRYVRGVGWGAEQTISGPGVVFRFSLKVSSSGHAGVVWWEENANAQRLWAAGFAP